MSLLIDNDFYAPWPRFGEHLSKQWGLIRANIQTLSPIGNAVILETDDGTTENSALAGFEFGSQTFPNQFRIVWNETQSQFRLDSNQGTTDSPSWTTIQSIDNDTTYTRFEQHVVFGSDITFNGDFYGLPTITPQSISDGAIELSSSSGQRFSVNENSFYIDFDSSGDPKINLTEVFGDLRATKGAFGNLGTEGHGVNLGGITYDANLKVSDITAGKPSVFQMHKHSKLIGPILLATRSNSNTTAHAKVISGQDLITLIAAGWTGSYYTIGGTIVFKVDSGTISDSSLPTKLVIATTKDGDTTPTTAITVGSDQTTDFASDITVSGTVTAGGNQLGILSASDGIKTITSPDEQFDVNSSDFYVSESSSGRPVINLTSSGGGGGGGITSVSISDGTHDFSSSSGAFSVNENDFYLDKDSSGNPKINLNKRFLGALIQKSSNQTFTTSSLADVTWDTEQYDVGGWFDSGSDNVNFVIPNGVSIIRASLNINWESTALEGERLIAILKNSAFFGGNAVWQSNFPANAAGTDRNTTINISTPPLFVTPGDTIGVQVRQETGSDLDVLSAFSTWFSIEALDFD